MVGLFKAVGGLVIALAILVAILMLFIGGIQGFTAGVVAALVYAFWGAAIFAFGLMLEHLEAIRHNSVRQSEMLTELLRRAPKADPSGRDPAADSLDQLEKSKFRFRDI
ncbi:hypothetical protein [Rhizobium lusitanum]|uniref:Putative membrane protein n=1 Tax=Rhizobium lusitanum TaxID=293958 RepID=A0A7X0MF45_9HYPH|nr:hypothetical protein [Rhizobium lusitanum]MBB6488379.1 putative membrane protein [Rhizobium lusitanum]